MRDYLLGSALAWLRDYRLDGLRLDAVHALADGRALTFLEELSTAVDALASELGRPLTLIAESDLCDPRTTTPRTEGGIGLHAQWNDDFHHALHTALTGETQGYYADFATAPLAALSKTVTRAFFHNGTYSSFRGRTHGRPVDVTRTPAHRFVGYAQTHDQIGNRALGDRLAAGLSPGLQACAAALVLTGPFTPMLFMGEEWGARTPGSSSPTTPTPGSRRPCATADGGSSRPTAGPRRTSPTLRTRPPGPAPASTGASRSASRTPGCSPGTAS